MRTGDIILIPFPYAELTNVKVRPAVVICITKDTHKDIVVSAISSVVPSRLNEREIFIKSDHYNHLRVNSIIKVDRIVTLKAKDKIANMGKLAADDLIKFKDVFRNLVK
jgi:mRNA interferase MazF